LSIKLWSYFWRISRVDDDGLFCGLVRHEVGIVIALPRPCTIV
jgi:hypothetical protein